MNRCEEANPAAFELRLRPSLKTFASIIVRSNRGSILTAEMSGKDRHRSLDDFGVTLAVIIAKIFSTTRLGFRKKA